jgi:Ca2+-binding RTX toxin-like protein
MAFYNGTSGDDVYSGGSAADDIYGNGGNDHLSGGDGDDSIDGGAGDDVLNGDSGSDTLDGGLGNDTLDGGTGDDFLLGGPGNDLLIGGSGDDALLGQDGDDTFVAGDGNDYMRGGAGVDSYDGGSNAPEPGLPWTLYGDMVSFYENRATQGVIADLRTGQILNDGFGNVETMTGIESLGAGTAFADLFYGNDGANSLNGALGDTLMSFGGDDDIIVEAAPALVDGGAGIDRIELLLHGSYIPDPNGGSVAILAPAMTQGYQVDLAAGTLVDGNGQSGTVTGIEQIVGTSLGDTLLGSSADEWFAPREGNDFVDGRGGIDAVSYAGDPYDYWTYGRGGIYVDLAAGFVGETEAEPQVIHGQTGDRVSAPAGTVGLDSTASSADILAGIENVYGTGLGDTIYGDSGDNLIAPGAGNDIVDGRDGIDTIDYSAARAAVSINLATGVANEQGTGEVRFDPTGTSTGTTIQADDYAASTDQLANIENAVGSAFADTIVGNSGANRLEGGAGDDLLDGGAGADTMIGGTGNDVFYVDDLGDVVTENAGEGTADEVRTALLGYVLPANVEKLTWTGTGGGDLRGNVLDNILTGGVGNDFVRAQDGGNDTVNLGAGNDAVIFGASYTSLDVVDGGTGKDQVGLQGDYSGGVTLGTLTGVETLAIMTHSDARFGGGSASLFSYNIVAPDSTVAAGTQLMINASTLEAGENLTFDGHAETDGSFFIYGGKGVDTLTGGSGQDVFFFAEDRFAATDHVDGGAGLDAMVLRGNYTLTLSGTSIVNVETVVLNSGSDARFYAAGTPFSYDITTADDTVAAGATMTFNGGQLNASETLHFDGSLETNGNFRLFGGSANDVIKGGAGNDLIYGGLGQDDLTGGGGADTFRYQGAGESTTTATDRILDFASGDIIDLGRIDAVTGGNDDAFHIVGAFDGQAGELVLTQGANNVWTVSGDTDGNGQADFQILVTVSDGHQLGSADFVL